MTKPHIVGLLIMEKSGITELAGAAPSISDLLMNVKREFIKQAQGSLVDGGVLKFQGFELETGDVLFEVIIDCKKPFNDIIKFQPL